MKQTLKLLVVSAFALLIAVPSAYAQTPEASILPVTEPLDVGGTILQPGTYTIRVMPSFSDRNKVQILDQEEKVITTVLTVPHPLEPTEEEPNTTFLYYPAAEGAPRALRTWFAPHPEASQGGHDIVYEESRARQLARLANSRVVYYPDEVEVAQFDDTELQIVTPEATVETYTYVPPTPVVTERQTIVETPAPMVSSLEMPATASRIPLMALLGLLSLVAAVALRFRA